MDTFSYLSDSNVRRRLRPGGCRYLLKRPTATRGAQKWRTFIQNISITRESGLLSVYTQRCAENTAFEEYSRGRFDCHLAAEATDRPRPHLPSERQAPERTSRRPH